MAHSVRVGFVRLWFFLLVVLAGRLLRPESAVAATTESPLRFCDGLLWIEIYVPQSRQPLHFLLDSGASSSVVNLGTARRLSLELGPKVAVNAVATTVTGYWPVKLSASASEIELPGEYLALDLSKLASACARPVDGLIGADFFRGRVVEIDYSAQRLRVLSASPARDATNSVPLESRPGGFLIALSVNGGKNEWVRVDTGCATAFQWVTSAHSTRCRATGAVGLTEISIPQTLTGIRIGGHYFDIVPTGLHRKAIFASESGLLGNGLLAQFGVVTIDTKTDRLFVGRTRVSETF